MGMRLARTAAFAAATYPVPRALPTFPSPQPGALAQAVWHINPLTGNDSADGLTAGTALASWAGLLARIGAGNTLTSPAVDIFVDGDLPITDPINLNLVFRPGGQIIRVHGSRTVTQSGTLTGFTPMNRPTNQAIQIQDTGVASFTPLVGQRLRFTNGPAADGIAWIAKGVAANTARVSNIAQVPIFVPGDFTDVTPVTPVVGNSYVIESLRKAFYGAVAVYSNGNDVGALSTLQFLDFDFQASDPTLNNDDDTVPNQTGTFLPCITFLACKFEKSTVSSGGETNFLNCCFASITGPRTSQTSYEAGLGLSTVLAGPATQAGGIDGANFDFDFMVQGASFTVRGGSWPRIGSLCVFDSPSDGIIVNPGGKIENSDANGNDSGVFALWGNGNSGVGYNGNVDSNLYYTMGSTPTITGAGGDIDLGNSSTTFQQYNGTNYNAAIAATWANVTAIGSAHVPADNAHILVVG